MSFEKYFLVAITLISCKYAMNMQSNSKMIELVKQSWINGEDSTDCIACDQCLTKIFTSYEFQQCSGKIIYKLPHFKPENLNCCLLFHTYKCARNLVNPACNQLKENEKQIVYDRLNTMLSDKGQYCKNVTLDQASKMCDVDTGDDLTFNINGCSKNFGLSYKFKDCLTNNALNYPKEMPDNYKECCDSWSYFQCGKSLLKPICSPPENQIDKVTNLLYESINYNSTKLYSVCNGTVEESYNKCGLKYNSSNNNYITWSVPFQIIISFVFYLLNFKL